MDYSDRVNSKKGAGGVAGRLESNVQTKQRIKELLSSQVLNLENDPYVFRNHLGILECRLCLTTHTDEALYISHIGGRKHTMSLERRRVLDERMALKNGTSLVNQISISNVQKRRWQKVGKPVYTITKIRDPDTLRVGVLVQMQLPKITAKEPLYRFMSAFELADKTRSSVTTYLKDHKTQLDGEAAADAESWQYLVVSAEPYENVAIALPADRKIERTEGENAQFFWTFWDADSLEFFIQLLFG